MADRSRYIIGGMLVLAAVIGGVAVAIGMGAFRPGPATPVLTTAKASVASVAETSSAPAAGSTASRTPTPAADAASALPAAATKITDQKQFGDWIYTCEETASATKSCSILQQLNDSKTNALLFQWRIVKASDGRLVALWQTPTGVMVGRGLVLDAGTGKPVVVSYNSCNPHNCDAVATVAADFQATLKSATTLKATITTNAGQNLVFSFSPKGLADALTALAAG